MFGNWKMTVKRIYPLSPKTRFFWHNHYLFLNASSTNMTVLEAPHFSESTIFLQKFIDRNTDQNTEAWPVVQVAPSDGPPLSEKITENSQFFPFFLNNLWQFWKIRRLPSWNQRQVLCSNVISKNSITERTLSWNQQQLAARSFETQILAGRTSALRKCHSL